MQTYETQAKAAFKEFYKKKDVSLKYSVRFFEKGIVLLLVFGIILGGGLYWYHHVRYGYVSFRFDDPVEYVVRAGLFIVFILLCISGELLKNARKTEREHVCRLMAKDLNYCYRTKRELTNGMWLAKRFGFIPRGVEVTSDFDTVSGDRLLHVQRVHWAKNAWYNVFAKTENEHGPLEYGFVVSCQLRCPVENMTVLVADSLVAKMQGKLGGWQRIKLEWLAWEESFDVFGTSEIETRKVLAPDVMAVLYDVYHVLKKPSMCFVFYKDKMSIFYAVGQEQFLLKKNELWDMFYHLYLLRYLPALLHEKIIALPEQETQVLRLARKAQKHSQV